MVTPDLTPVAPMLGTEANDSSNYSASEPSTEQVTESPSLSVATRTSRFIGRLPAALPEQHRAPFPLAVDAAPSATDVAKRGWLSGYLHSGS